MRISSIVKVLEDSTITAAHKTAVAYRAFKDEVDKETLVRTMYRDEQRAPKRKRLEELRELVTQMDKQMTAKENEHA